MANNGNGALVRYERQLNENLPAIAAAAAQHLEPKRLIRVSLTALQSGVNLTRCTPESVLLAVMNAAYLGLEPTGFLGDAYLIPYGDTCTLQIGYKGLIKLMKRTGEVTRVEAHEVWDCDEFRYQYGTDPRIEHVPGRAADRDEMVAAYAVAWMRDGLQQFEVMTPDEIRDVRAKSRAADKPDSPWQTFPAMMWRKSAVRRLANYVELSTEARVGIAYDDRATIGETISVTEVDPDSHDVNEHVRIATDAKVEDVKGQLDRATKLAAAKREVGEAVKAAGWPMEAILHFAQTVHGSADASVDHKAFGVDEWETVLEAIKNARTMRDEGQDVRLTSYDDPTTAYILPAFETREA